MSLPIDPSLHDAIFSPFDDEVSYDDSLSYDADLEINERRASAENAETMRLARAL